MREMAPIGEMAPGCAKKYKKEILRSIKKPVRTRCHLTHDYGICEDAFKAPSMLAIEINTNETATIRPQIRWMGGSMLWLQSTIRPIQSCFFVKVDAPRTTEQRNREPTG